MADGTQKTTLLLDILRNPDSEPELVLAAAEELATRPLNADETELFFRALMTAVFPDLSIPGTDADRVVSVLKKTRRTNRLARDLTEAALDPKRNRPTKTWALDQLISNAHIIRHVPADQIERLLLPTERYGPFGSAQRVKAWKRWDPLIDLAHLEDRLVHQLLQDMSAGDAIVLLNEFPEKLTSAQTNQAVEELLREQTKAFTDQDNSASDSDPESFVQVLVALANQDQAREVSVWAKQALELLNFPMSLPRRESYPAATRAWLEFLARCNTKAEAFLSGIGDDSAGIDLNSRGAISTLWAAAAPTTKVRAASQTYISRHPEHALAKKLSSSPRITQS